VEASVEITNDHSLAPLSITTNHSATLSGITQDHLETSSPQEATPFSSSQIPVKLYEYPARLQLFNAMTPSTTKELGRPRDK
jgi:hypothetical protein